MSGYIDSLVVKIIAKLAGEGPEKPRVELRFQRNAADDAYIWTARTSPRYDYPVTSGDSVQAAVRELVREVGAL